MAKDSDPIKDPEFQKAVQALLKAPPQPHKPLGKRVKRREHRSERSAMSIQPSRSLRWTYLRRLFSHSKNFVDGIAKTRRSGWTASQMRGADEFIDNGSVRVRRECAGEQLYLNSSGEHAEGWSKIEVDGWGSVGCLKEGPCISGLGHVSHEALLRSCDS